MLFLCQTLFLGILWGLLFSPFIILAYITCASLVLFFYIQCKYKVSTTFSPLSWFLLLSGRYVVQFFWIFQTLQQQLNFLYSLSWFVVLVLIYSLVFYALLLVLQKCIIQQPLSLPLALFTIPFVSYVEACFFSFLPSLYLPSFSLAEQAFILQLPYIKYIYPIVGIEGVSFILYWLALLLVFTPKKAVYVVILFVCIVYSIAVLQKSNLYRNKNISFLALRTPSNGKLNDKKTKQFLLKQIKKYNQKDIQFILIPETAIVKPIEESSFMETIGALLYKNQTLLVGSNRKRLSTRGFDYYNSVYIIKNKLFRFAVKDKEYLVPFAEYLPQWAGLVGLILPRKHSYIAGRSKLISLNNFLVAIGICMDAYLSSWYKEYQKADFHITLHRESDFSIWGKKQLYFAEQAKTWQSGKTTIRWVSDGKEGVFSLQDKAVLFSHYYSHLVWQGKIKISSVYSVFYQWHWLIMMIICMWQMVTIFVIKRRQNSCLS